MKYRFVAISQGGAPPEKIFVKHNRKMLSPKFAGRIICAMHDYLVDDLFYTPDEIEELIARCRLKNMETVIERLEE